MSSEVDLHFEARGVILACVIGVPCLWSRWAFPMSKLKIARISSG